MRERRREGARDGGRLELGERKEIGEKKEGRD